MAARDTQLFKLLFGPNGVITQFYRNPQTGYVIADGRYFSKRATMRLLRSLLPPYRTYQDDNDLVEKLYQNQAVDLNIRRLLTQDAPILSQAAHDELDYINNLPFENREQTQNLWAQRLEQPTATTKEEPTGIKIINKIHYLQRLPYRIPIMIKRLIIRGIPPLKALRYYQVKAQIPVKRFLRKFFTPTRLTSISTSLIGAAVGGGVAGIPGALVGAATGWFAPSFITGGGGNLLLRMGGVLTGGGSNLLLGVGRLALVSFPVTAVVVIVGIVALLVIVVIILPTTQLTPPTVVEAGLVNDISSCQLTRSSQTPTAVSIKSTILANLFKEAETITTIPAQVLAGVARLENPAFIAGVDDNHDALFDRNFSDPTTCAPHFKKSDTGALGIMQLQPPGTTGYFEPGIEYGASLLGKTKEQVNYCNIRENIIVSAGFILKKLQIGYSLGDGQTWDLSWTNNKDVISVVANSFYGCLQYGGTDPTKCEGPYNYGDDLWISVQTCKVTFAPASCPILGGKIKVASLEKDPNSGHCSPFYGICPSNSRKAKSIDVDAKGQNVILPTIGTQSVSWSYLTQFPLNKPGDCEGGLTNCGVGVVFQARVGPDIWVLHLLHLDDKTLNLKTGELNQSGISLGKTVPGVYLHINIGKNIINPASPPKGFNDLDPGWTAPDSICQ